MPTHAEHCEKVPVGQKTLHEQTDHESAPGWVGALHGQLVVELLVVQVLRSGIEGFGGVNEGQQRQSALLRSREKE